MIISDSYLSDFKGLAGTRSVNVTDRGEQLEDLACKFVKLSNFNVSNLISRPFDTTDAKDSGFEIYWGFSGNPSFQLFAGEQTELLPIQNLNQITLQARPGDTRQIWITYFY